MGIRPTFNQNDIEKNLLSEVKRIEQAIIRRFQYLGELCLVECRSSHTYTDRTGNLTASMGYVVMANGRQVTTGGFDGRTGGTTGKALADQIASRFSSGFALIVVAGMNYAYSVESMGYNVLSSSELLAERELPKMMAALSRNIGKIN